MVSVLYITYTGLLEPLGQSQVVNYLVRLAETQSIAVLSFEKPADTRDRSAVERMQQRLSEQGIRWYRLRYHKWPPAIATWWDIVRGLFVSAWVVVIRRVRLVHCRSYIAGVIGLWLKRLFGCKFLFDMRGFWADERVDGGMWPADGRMYKIAKGFERQFLLNADAVVSLTHAGVREMQQFDYLQERTPPFHVITTCTDLNHFRPLPKPSDLPLTIGYIGAAGTWYLFDKTVQAMKVLLDLRPDARLLVINRNEHDLIQRTLDAAGVSGNRYEIASASFEQVPERIAQIEAAIFFLKPAFSKKASAPTRLGELLACGKPCLVNAGVGDMEQIVTENQTGVCLQGLSDDEIEQGVRRLLELIEEQDIANRCRRAAEKHFSLEAGVAAYLKLYESVLAA